MIYSTLCSAYSDSNQLLLLGMEQLSGLISIVRVRSLTEADIFALKASVQGCARSYFIRVIHVLAQWHILQLCLLENHCSLHKGARWQLYWISSTAKYVISRVINPNPTSRQNFLNDLSCPLATDPRRHPSVLRQVQRRKSCDTASMEELRSLLSS
jgi:hypothetical protein